MLSGSPSPMQDWAAFRPQLCLWAALANRAPTKNPSRPRAEADPHTDGPLNGVLKTASSHF
jgi:hypothetical protein